MIKKQLLLLVALISCAPVSANNAPTDCCVANETVILTLFFTGFAFLAYKFITDGVHPSAASWTNHREEESDFMRNDYNYPFGRVSDTTNVERPITVRPIS